MIDTKEELEQTGEEADESPETEQSSDPRNLKLPEEQQLQLRGLCKKFAGRELKDRRFEVRRARKARFFWRGVQHLLWNDDAQTMVIGQSGGAIGAGDSSANQPTFMRDFNIYTPYGKAFCSTFCQNQPATRFEPESPKEAIDLKTAAAANKYRRVFEKWNPPRQIQLELARLLWTDDRVVAWTRYEKDGQRFGYDKDENGKETGRGREITTLHGVLEHKCPITIKDSHDFVFQQISKDLDTATVKAKYPEIADKITQGSQGGMDDAFARNARISTSEGTTALSEGGDSLAHLSTIDYFWLRPDAFELLDEEYRQPLKDKFPKGVRAAFVGDVYAESVPTSMDDELTVFHATAGDGQNRNGMGDWLIPVNEVFNNLMNMTQEYYEYGIPEEWLSSEIFDIDAIQEQRSQPGGRQTFNRPSGMAADDLFHESPTAEPPASMMAFMQYLQGAFAQFVSGQQAAIFGKSDQHNETAKGIELLRDQALGLVSLVWMPFTLGWANVVHQAVKAAANNREGSISTLVSVPGKKGATEPIDVDIEDLRGNVLCSPETDENFPESWTQKSNKVIQLFAEAEKNPALAPIAMLPPNQQLYKLATGLDDLTIPGQASNEKQLAEIDELLETGPETDPATGQPMSTIPIDPDFDDHAAEWQAGLAWVNDPEAGQKAKREDPDGFLNVRLHLLQHKAQNDQKQAQQLEQQMQLKHPSPPPPDPQTQQAKALLLHDAADAVTQLDLLSKTSPLLTQGNITGQVTAANDLLNAAVKAAQPQ